VERALKDSIRAALPNWLTPEKFGLLTQQVESTGSTSGAGQRSQNHKEKK